MINATKISQWWTDDLLNFCAVYKAQNADNARTFEIWFDDKFRKFMQQMTPALSEKHTSVYN